jgi:hypothetical protein
VQSAFCIQSHTEPPYLFKPGEIDFKEKRCIWKGIIPGRPSVSDAPSDRVRACFQSRPQTSKLQASLDMQLVHKNSISKFLCTRLLVKSKTSTGTEKGNRIFGHAIQTLQRDTSQDQTRSLALKVHFSDEAVTSHIKEKVNPAYRPFFFFWRTEVDA